jgi:hypothetical protein
MTDQELLKHAARVSGAKMTDYSDRTPDHWIIEHAPGQWRAWNPLNDDGDAFRLMAETKIRWGFVTNNHLEAAAPNQHAAREQVANGDRFAALRRAIVRAAATIDADNQGQ